VRLAVWCAVLARRVLPLLRPGVPGGARMAAAVAGGGGFLGKWVFALRGMTDCFCYLKKKKTKTKQTPGDG